MYSIKKSLKSKLTWYLAGCVIVSGVVACFIGYMFFHFATNYVEQVFEDEAINQTWQIKYLDDLQEYVNKNGITSDTIKELKEWTDENAYVYLSVYQNQQLVFNSDYAYGEAMENSDLSVDVSDNSQSEMVGELSSSLKKEQENNTADVLEESDLAEALKQKDSIEKEDGQGQENVVDLNNEESEYLYRLALTDGTVARVDIFCYDYWKYNYYVMGIALVIGVGLFIIMLTSLINRKIRYINNMAKELQILEGGNLEYPITIKGKDELANLARGIEQMRLSVIENRKKEQEMLQGNKELVTSMSHDLRTPLTTLTGYLEILNMGNVKDEEKRKHYLELSLAKSHEIKQLSDDLFEYFLIYGENEKHIEVEPVSASMLAEDLISNQLLGLEEDGYEINGVNNIPMEAGNCLINIKYMQRVLNNIISNLSKYADKNFPIEVSANLEQQFMVLRVRNVICQNVEPHESTKIGLITCERIMRLHHGEFQKFESEGEFTVKLVIPMEEK